MISKNLEGVRAVYDAFAKGDIPTVLEFLSADISWTEAEGFPYGGTYIGPSAVLSGVFMKLGSEWDNFSAIPHEFIEAGDTIVVLGKYGGKFKATNKIFLADFAHVWKIRNGEAISFRQYTDTLIVDKALRA